MEEKERYEISVGSDYITIKDYEENRIKALSNYQLQGLLNRQDKRIKELEATNKILSNELTNNNIVKSNKLETCCGIPIYEIPKLKEENYFLKEQNKSLTDEEEYISQKMKEIGFDNIEDLCKSQKQLAVVQLEKVEEILWDSQDIGNLMDNDKFLEKLNYLIKSLKGE